MVNTQKKKNIQKLYKGREIQKIIVTPKEEPKQEVQQPVQQPQPIQEQRGGVGKIVDKVKNISLGVISKAKTGVKAVIEKITPKKQEQQISQQPVQQPQTTIQELQVKEEVKKEKVKKKKKPAKKKESKPKKKGKK